MLSKLSLKNWKSHAATEIEFKPGINIILGPMGSGKSSILQAISFALFGTFSELKSKDLKLIDVIQRGRDVAELTLELSNGFNITRRIENGRSSEAVVRDADGNLLAGTNPAQVNNYIKSNLNIDEDIFLRTVYARQNDIDLFLRLSPGERKTKLDQIMGLDKFELARKACIKFVNKLAERIEQSKKLISGLHEDELNSEITALNEELETLGKKVVEQKKEVSVLKEKKEILQTKLKEEKERKSKFERFQAKHTLLKGQIGDLKTKLANFKITLSHATLAVRERELAIKLDELQRARSLVKAELDKNQKALLTVSRTLASAEEKLNLIRNSLQEIEKLQEELKELKTSEDELARTQSELKELEQKRHARLAEQKLLEKAIVELQKAGSECPICSSPLDFATKGRLVKERQEKLAKSKAELRTLETKTAELQTKIRELELELRRQKLLEEKIAMKDELRAQELQLLLEQSKLKGEQGTVQKALESTKSRLDELEDEISTLDAQTRELSEQKILLEQMMRLEKMEDELAKIERELKLLEFDPEKLKELETEFEGILVRWQKAKSKIDTLEQLRAEKRKRVADLLRTKEELEQLKQNIALDERRMEFMEKFRNALLNTQSALRQQLISAVNEVMHAVWAALYPYERWEAVRLSASENDYILELKDRNGNWFPVVGFASGGERMLACLALRIAFAKVLAPQLGLLILDEPTHNLDAAAISTFVEVLQEKLAGAIDQLIIVTHEERLAEAGENVIRLS